MPCDHIFCYMYETKLLRICYQCGLKQKRIWINNVDEECNGEGGI